MNYNAKSGAPSLQIEEVMINFCILVAILIFGGHLAFTDNSLVNTLSLFYRHKHDAWSHSEPNLDVIATLLPYTPSYHHIVTPGLYYHKVPPCHQFMLQRCRANLL